MNTLTGYSKSTLTDGCILTAAGGHLPQQELMSAFYGGDISKNNNTLTLDKTFLTVGGKTLSLGTSTVDILENLNITLDTTTFKLKLGINGIGAESNEINSLYTDNIVSHAKHTVENYELLPQTYNKGARFEFVKSSALGLANIGTYCGILHYRPYGNNNDFSGGGAFLLAFTSNNNLWLRGSNVTTLSSNYIATWDAWRKIAYTSDITAELNKLNKSDNPINNQYVSSVTQTNGLIDVSHSPFPSIEDLGGISPDDVNSNINNALQSVYWANLKLGATANFNTKPTFAEVTTNTIQSLENLELQLKSTNSIIGLGANVVNDNNPPIDLGTIANPWKNLYIKNEINFGGPLAINYGGDDYNILKFNYSNLLLLWLFLNISPQEIPELTHFINPGDTWNEVLNKTLPSVRLTLFSEYSTNFYSEFIDVPKSGKIKLTLPLASLSLNNVIETTPPESNGITSFLSYLIVNYDIYIGNRHIATYSVEMSDTHTTPIDFTLDGYTVTNKLKLNLNIDLKIGVINGNYVYFKDKLYHINELSSVTCTFTGAIKLEILRNTLYNKANHLLLYKNGLCFVGDKSAIYFGENRFQVHLGKLILDLGYHESDDANDSMYLRYSKDGGHTYTDF